MVCFNSKHLLLFAGYGPPPTDIQPGAVFTRDTLYTDGRGWTNELHLFDLDTGMYCLSVEVLLIFMSRFMPLASGGYSAVEHYRTNLDDVITNRLCIVNVCRIIIIIFPIWCNKSESSFVSYVNSWINLWPLLFFVLLQVSCHLLKWLAPDHLPVLHSQSPVLNQTGRCCLEDISQNVDVSTTYICLTWTQRYRCSYYDRVHVECHSNWSNSPLTPSQVVSPRRFWHGGCPPLTPQLGYKIITVTIMYM